MGTTISLKYLLFIPVVGYLIGISSSSAQTIKCPAGTYLHQEADTFYCLPCKDGTFMPKKNHTETKCAECTKIEDLAIEVLISPCNTSHNANIQCSGGYYRRIAGNPRDKDTCEECSPCPEKLIETFRCQNFTDTVCCPDENHDTYVESRYRLCRERPYMCRRGEYLDTSQNDCKPCPENTFMTEDYHSHTKCWDCHHSRDADLPLHAEIIEPCTSIRPPRYACVTGFYVNHSLSYRGDDIGCSPCQVCGVGMYIGRQCEKDYDTVCCNKPNMTVLKGPIGWQCVESKNCTLGTDSPTMCNKTCSQFCRPAGRPEASPCNHNDGSCLYGCIEDRTGSMCETSLDEGTRSVSEGKSSDTGIAAISVILGIPVALVFICVLYIKCCFGSGPKCLQALVRHILPPSQKTRGETPEELGLISEKEDDYACITDVKEKVKADVTTLQQMQDFSDKQKVMDFHGYLCKIFIKYPNHAQEIGDYLADLKHTETCVKLVEEYLIRRLIVQDDWPVMLNTYMVLRNYSTYSTSFATSLVDFGGVKVLTDILRQDAYINNLDRKMESQVINAAIFGLCFIASHIGSTKDFKEKNTIEALKNLTESDNESIKVYAMLTLSYIMDEEEKARNLDDTNGVIKIIVQWIRKAQENKEDQRYRGLKPAELFAGLQRLAVNEENKRKIDKELSRDLLLSLLSPTEPTEKSWTEEKVWELQYDGHDAQSIKAPDDVVIDVSVV